MYNPNCSVGRLLLVLMTTLYGSGGFTGKWMEHSLQWERPTLWAGHVLSLPQVSVTNTIKKTSVLFFILLLYLSMRKVEVINNCIHGVTSQLTSSAFVKGLQSKLKRLLPRPRGQRVLVAWRHPSLLLVLPVEPPCLCPPAPPHLALLRTLRLLLFAREHHHLSNSGYPRAVDPPVR